MLVSTFELITLAASNSLAVFCFCNLIIIAILLVGSSKPSSHSDEAKLNGFPTIVNDHNFKKNIVSEGNELMETEEEKVSSVSIDMVENEEETPDEDDEEEEDDDDDDELRKRVEEFIEKINKGWRAEKLKTYTLGQ